MDTLSPSLSLCQGPAKKLLIIVRPTRGPGHCIGAKVLTPGSLPLHHQQPKGTIWTLTFHSSIPHLPWRGHAAAAGTNVPEADREQRQTRSGRKGRQQRQRGLNRKRQGLKQYPWDGGEGGTDNRRKLLNEGEKWSLNSPSNVDWAEFSLATLSPSISPHARKVTWGLGGAWVTWGRAPGGSKPPLPACGAEDELARTRRLHTDYCPLNTFPHWLSTPFDPTLLFRSNEVRLNMTVLFILLLADLWQKALAEGIVQYQRASWETIKVEFHFLTTKLFS